MPKMCKFTRFWHFAVLRYENNHYLCDKIFDAMERDIFEKLRQWKDSKNRKPILLQGARQIGKTWIML